MHHYVRILLLKCEHTAYKIPFYFASGGGASVIVRSHTIYHQSEKNLANGEVECVHFWFFIFILIGLVFRYIK